MWRRSWSARSSQGAGFVLVTLLVAMPVLWFSVYGGWQVTRAVQGSHERQRGLDRAAYSGAAKIADTLNAIALHNQGAVGAHLLQGHLVTQMAWTEYAAQLARRGGAVMALALPGIGAAIMRTASHALSVQRQQMPVWTQLLGAAGQTHQWLAWGRIASLASQLPATIEDTGAGLVSRWLVDPQALAGFRAVAMQGPVLDAAIDDRRWIQTRSWRSSVIWIAGLEKHGVTEAENGQWRAQDELSMTVKRWFRTKRIRLAGGDESSAQHGYLGAADLIAFQPQSLWLSTYAQPDVSVAWTRPSQPHALDAVLLWPVWDATRQVAR